MPRRNSTIAAGTFREMKLGGGWEAARALECSRNSRHTVKKCFHGGLDTLRNGARLEEMSFRHRLGIIERWTGPRGIQLASMNCFSSMYSLLLNCLEYIFLINYKRRCTVLFSHTFRATQSPTYLFCGSWLFDFWKINSNHAYSGYSCTSGLILFQRNFTSYVYLNLIVSCNLKL